MSAPRSKSPSRCSPLSNMIKTSWQSLFSFEFKSLYHTSSKKWPRGGQESLLISDLSTSFITTRHDMWTPSVTTSTHFFPSYRRRERRRKRPRKLAVEKIVLFKKRKKRNENKVENVSFHVTSSLVLLRVYVVYFALLPPVSFVWNEVSQIYIRSQV